ncbi:ergosterol biosynthesis protein [Mucor velutinosus]|uniref:Ergosterol biosynthesis protein n=1 Tax=Mucor velutinosus TaxID=708070 RepID=A0AAN7DMN4_9FUNG|nr:ergosterol biosynthesis protein [Mucor velutinosus]
MQSVSSGAYLKTSANDGGEVKLRLSQPAILYVQMNKNSQLQQPQPLIEYVRHDLTLELGTSQLLMTSFPLIVSDILDTERSQIASPKVWLMDHQEPLGMETLYFKGESFYAPPHIITILLGEYDDRRYPAAGPMYIRRLFTFLSNIRYRFPHAFIIVLSEPLGVLFQESQKAALQMSVADENIAFVDTTVWIRYGPTHYTNPLHLNDKGQELFAHKLAPLLKAKLNGLPFPVQPNPNLPYDW